MKFLFIIQWYGKLPIWFPITFKTMINNYVDFLLIGDFENSADIYINYIEKNNVKNIKFIYFSKIDLKKIIKKKLDIDLYFYPYKCCDLKPIYGILFNNYIIDYDYWGYCDIDLFFSNLKVYLEKISTNIEIISGDTNCPIGPFTLFKNNKLNNEMCKELDLKLVLESRLIYGIDEGHDFEGKTLESSNTNNMKNIIKKNIYKKDILNNLFSVQLNHYDYHNYKCMDLVYYFDNLYLLVNKKFIKTGCIHLNEKNNLDFSSLNKINIKKILNKKNLNFCISNEKFYIF
jgi:hypothetical protein